MPRQVVVINIITKIGEKLGVTGNFRTGYSQGIYGSFNAGSDVTYRTKKITFNSKLNYWRNNNWSDINSSRAYDRVYDRNLIQDDIERLERSTSYMIQLGIDYRFNENHTLGAIVNGNINEVPMRSDVYTKFIGSDFSLDSTLYTISDWSNKSSTYSYSLHYHGKLDTLGKELIVIATHTPYQMDLRQAFTSQVIGANNTIVRVPDPYRTINPSDIQIDVGQIDYVHPFTNKWKLEAGLKYSGV